MTTQYFNAAILKLVVATHISVARYREWVAKLYTEYFFADEKEPSYDFFLLLHITDASSD